MLHEDFLLDDRYFTATLRSIVVLCGRCTEARRNLLVVAASMGGRGNGQPSRELPLDPDAQLHFMAINRWDERDVGRYAYGVYQRWLRRERWLGATWRVELQWLQDKLGELQLRQAASPSARRRGQAPQI